MDHFGQNDFLGGSLIDETHRDASADHVIGLDGHLAEDGVKNFRLREWVVWVQSVVLASDLTYFNDSKGTCTVLPDQMLRNVARHFMLENQEVLVLLEDLYRVLDEAIT